MGKSEPQETKPLEADSIVEADAYTAPSLDDLRDAAHGMQDSVKAFVMDEGEGTVGAPVARDLVLGEDDPRDAELAEIITGEETLFTGLIFDVNRIHVKLPNGHESARDVTRHSGAVGIVALTDDGRICLVRQFRTALGRVTVEIPRASSTRARTRSTARSASSTRRPAWWPTAWRISRPSLRRRASPTS